MNLNKFPISTEYSVSIGCLVAELLTVFYPISQPSRLASLDPTGTVDLASFTGASELVSTRGDGMHWVSMIECLNNNGMI